MIQQKFGTLVIDGDYLAYLAAFVTQSTVHTYKDSEGKVIVSKPSSDTCKKYIDKLGLDIEALTVEKEVVIHKNWETIAKATVANKIKKWKAATGCSRVIIAMGRSYKF